MSDTSMADWIALAVSAASMIVGVASALYARNANLQANQALKLSSGEAETNLREAIQIARRRFEDVLAESEELRAEFQSAGDDATRERIKFRLEPKKKRMNSAIEGLFSAYDSACRRYLEQKIDRESFKREFLDEIRDVVSDEPFKSRFDEQRERRRGTYQFVVRVYDEWFVAK